MQSVLLVDDELSIVSGLQDLLALEDIPASIATSAESAEAMINDNFYGVVLADLRLRSDEDGLRLIETIRRVSPGSKVAAMTGYATVDTEKAVIGFGASHLLLKPFETDAFLAIIRELRSDDFETVYRQTGPRLRAMMNRRYGLSHDQCEDVLQQAWCVLIEKRRQVRDIGPWLAGTVINLCRQTIHRCTRERAFDLDGDDSRTTNYDAVTTLAVHSALARLDERSRQLCELIGLEEVSYQEASQCLGIPLGSIGPLYMRAKERLKKELAN